MSVASVFKHHIKLVKTEFEQDEYGSMVKTDKCSICTKAQIVHNGGGRENQNGDIFFEYGKIFRVRIYVPVQDYDELEYDGSRYRILSIDKSEDFQNIEIKTELINT